MSPKLLRILKSILAATIYWQILKLYTKGRVNQEKKEDKI